MAVGTENIPCGPAPTSPLSGSPRGGGVEALRASRQGSIPVNNMSGSSPSFAYGNLTAGGSGASSPSAPGREREKDKEDREKKGLYPSRVVLTSQ